MQDLQRPRVSVIIPTYRDWQDLERCLQALAEQTYPKEAVEIIVINNDPGNTPPQWRVADNVQLLAEAKPGSYAARNCGLKHASGEIIAFTDSDCAPQADWLECAVRAIDDGAVRVAGRVQFRFRSDKLSWTEIYEKAYSFNQPRLAARGVAVTANMITLKSIFEKVGFFDEQLQSGGDIEWGWRAQAAGIPIRFDHRVCVVHPARYSFAEMIAKNERVARGAIGRIGNQSFAAKFWAILKGLIPPLHRYPYLFARKDLSFYERVVAGLYIYILKLTSSYFKFKYWVFSYRQQGQMPE